MRISRFTAEVMEHLSTTEWRLTQDGRRIRASLPQPQERGDEILLPVPA
jgi:hypothetical protein